ncbi:biotin synthase auxiliary protein BsaP [Arthrobacter oryzae]|uniref:biotin synthase auxiliary protein BsaP n=1 Tax=Arthrobacter oryzae TaxID=409290 RepID=UPI004038D233
MNRVSTSSTAGTASTAAEFCGHCGEPSDGGASPTSDVHRRCAERLAMEPPRYCAACRRRMKVQVTPLGWSAECARHGVLAP